MVITCCLTLTGRDDVEGLFIGRKDNSIGVGQVVDQAVHLAGGGDVVDGRLALGQGLGGPELGVGEVDAALPVDDEVVGRVEALAVVPAGHYAAGLTVRADGGDLAV